MTPWSSYKGDLTKVGSTTPDSPFMARMRELVNRAPADVSLDRCVLTETHREGGRSSSGLGLDDLVTTELNSLDEVLVLLT